MKSSFEKAYLRELQIQSEYARTSVKQMNESLAKRRVTALFFREAQGFISRAAAISRILWPPRAKDARAKDRGNIFGPFSVFLIITRYEPEPFVITLSTSTSAWTSGVKRRHMVASLTSASVLLRRSSKEQRWAEGTSSASMN
jgi:hypothetical protein